MRNFFGERLRQIRECKNWNQSELAKKTEIFCKNHPEIAEHGIKPIAPSSINRWERGENFPGVDNLILLSLTLGVNINHFVSEELNLNNGIDIFNSVQIPVLNSLKANINFEMQKDIINFIDIPKTWLTGKREFFALRINDDSMLPRYSINDIVIFEKEEDISAADKKDCAITIGNDNAIFRNATISSSGITLVPLNLNNSNNYQPVFYSNEDIEKMPIKIIGSAIEKRTKL